jgi:hypothetical protein
MAGTTGISRRQFVGSAAAVAAISSLAGKSVLAAASGERSALASTALRHQIHAELLRLQEQLGIREFSVKEWPVSRHPRARTNKPN